MMLTVPILAGGWSGCAKEEPQNQTVVKKPVSKKTAETTVGPAVADNAIVAKTSEPSLYSPAGKRDPFTPFIKPLKAVSQAEIPAGPPSLQSQDAGSFKYVGMVWSPRGVRALIEDIEGRGYTVTVGSRLGRGGAIVTRITDKEIVVKEEFKDYTGATVVRESSLKLKSAGGK